MSHFKKVYLNKRFFSYKINMMIRKSYQVTYTEIYFFFFRNLLFQAGEDK